MFQCFQVFWCLDLLLFSYFGVSMFPDAKVLILILTISTCKVEGQSPARDTVPGVASHSDSSHFRFFHPSQNNAKFECYKKPLTCQLPAVRRAGEGHWKVKVKVMDILDPATIPSIHPQLWISSCNFPTRMEVLRWRWTFMDKSKVKAFLQLSLFSYAVLPALQ